MAGKFDDSQLRIQVLKLKDPYDQPDLLCEWPDGAELVDIINVYVYDQFPAKKAFCVECHGHHHKRGFTALLTSGHRVMLGSKCGAERFGQSWSDAEKRIEERADRQFELRKLDRLERCLSAFDGVLGARRAMEQISNRQKAFFAKAGELGSRAREAALHDQGNLKIYKKIERRAAGGNKQITEAISFTRIEGYQYLVADDPLQAMERFIDAFDAMRDSIGKSDALATKTLAKLRRNFERACESVEQAFKTHEAAHAFFRPHNFRLMVAWANSPESPIRETYSFDDDILQSRSGGLKILPVDDLKIDLLTAIQEYRRAD